MNAPTLFDLLDETLPAPALDLTEPAAWTIKKISQRKLRLDLGAGRILELVDFKDGTDMVFAIGSMQDSGKYFYQHLVHGCRGYSSREESDRTLAAAVAIYRAGLEYFDKLEFPWNNFSSLAGL